MDKIITKSLLARVKVLPELHLKQAGFTHIACGLFTKHRERIHKFRETSN